MFVIEHISLTNINHIWNNNNNNNNKLHELVLLFLKEAYF
jgi:hypothetical protein